MYICKFCGKQFNKTTSFVAHLSSKNSPCKINIKEYYDRFLRESNEGMCEYCGRETSFAGISKGYPYNICKYCKSKDPTIIEKQKQSRQKYYDEKKTNSNLPVVCEICGDRFKNRAGLSRHVNRKHNISSKEYYDKYLKVDNEGVCPITGKETKFKNLTEGYYKYYGRGSCSKDSQVKSKKENTILSNYNVDNPVYVNQEERIKNFKRTFEDRRKLNDKRLELLNILRILTIDNTNKLQCQICGRIFTSYTSLGLHINSHGLNSSEYYRRYIQKPDRCQICGVQVNFQNLSIGYAKYCRHCAGRSEETISGAKESSKKYLRNKAIKLQDYYNIEILDQNQINLVSDKIDIRCKLCGRIYKNSLYNLWLGYGKCPICFRQPIKSSYEGIFSDYIKSLTSQIDLRENDYSIIRNPNTGKRLELDLYFPDKNLAIEINGLYWHSELVLNDPENYHLMKLLECNKNGIELLQFFEDEIIFKEKIVKSIIKNKLGLNTDKIYARKCTISEIDPRTKNKFLNENHIQGEDKSVIKLGAFYNSELISVMTFGKGSISGSKLNSELDWDLSRFCTKLGYNIPGIASKLLEYFKNKYNWKNIYSYTDLRISNYGDLYRKLGFEYMYQTKPDYWYVSNILRIHRFNLRKTKDEPKDTPEWKLRLDQGYYRIWDCGKLKFVLENI